MKRLITFVLSAACVFMGVLCAIVAMVNDNISPVITVPQGSITYTEGEEPEKLLTGVKANDNKDGDISGEVRIYNISIMESGNTALVTYAVYDSNYNLGKATKVISYISRSREEVEIPDIEPEPEEETTEATTEATTEEIPEGYEDLPLESTGAPVIRLNTHEVHIEVGEDFYSMDYVEDAIDDVDSKEYLYRNMYLEGEYDTDTEGEYEISYYCVDSEGNVSNYAKLKIIVGGENDMDDSQE